MKSVFIGLLVCLSLVICTTSGWTADPWNNQDIVLQTIVQGTLFLDYLQTRQIAKHPNLYYETNKIIGRHPSLKAVNVYFVAASLAHVGFVHILPKKLRPYFQTGTILLEINVIKNNCSLGLGFRW